MGGIIHKCPKCSKTSVVWNYGKHKPVCARCDIPARDFVRDETEYLGRKEEIE